MIPWSATVGKAGAQDCAPRFLRLTMRRSGTNSVALAVADFNLDNHPDLVAASRDEISVLYGKGDGTFAPVESFPSGAYVSQLLSGDLDGNGRPELVVLGGSDRKHWAFFQNRCAGERPRLGFERTGNLFRLAWPAGPNAWVLETADDPAATDWHAAPGAPANNGLELPFDAVVRARFFRLRQGP